jgi:hypothetical protein
VESGDVTERPPQGRRQSRRKKPRIDGTGNCGIDVDRCDDWDPEHVLDIAPT